MAERQSTLSSKALQTHPLPQPRSAAEKGPSILESAIEIISSTEAACPLSIPRSLSLRAHSENTSVASLSAMRPARH